MSEQPTIRVAGDPIAQRDQLAAMATEALRQRDRLLFALGAVLEQFPKPEDVQTVEGRFQQVESRPVPLRRLREWWAVIHTLKSIDATPLLASLVAATAPDQPTRVPDLPCPKCGDADVRVRYCDGCKLRHNTSACSHGEREHFHRSCRRCGFDWKTDDAIDAKAVSR